MHTLFQQQSAQGSRTPDVCSRPPTAHCSLSTVHCPLSTVHRPARRAGFTLVELLMVMVIGTILVSMAAGVYMQARNAAKRARAETQLRELTKAWTEYWIAYESWPASVGSGNNVAMNKDTLHALYATEDDGVTQNPENPRGLALFSVKLQPGDPNYPNYTDPWGNPYKIAFKSPAISREVAMRITVGFPNRDRYRP